MANFKPRLETLEGRLVPASILFPQGLPFLYDHPQNSDSTVRVWLRDAAGDISHQDFVPYPGFKNSVTVAQGDIDRDNIPEIITGCGNGGPSGHITLWDGAKILTCFADGMSNMTQPVANGGALLASFYAFPGYNAGLSVRLGDMDGDHHDDILFSPGIEAGPYTASHVRIWDGLKTIAAFAKPTPVPYDYQSFELASFYCLGSGGDAGRGGLSLAVQRREGNDHLVTGQFFSDTVSCFTLNPSLSGRQTPTLLQRGSGSDSGNSTAVWEDLVTRDLRIATSDFFPEYSPELQSSTNRFLPDFQTLDAFPYDNSGRLYLTEARPLYGQPPAGTVINRLGMANIDPDPEEELLVAYRDTQQVDVYDRVVVESMGITNETLVFQFTLGDSALPGGSWV